MMRRLLLAAGCLCLAHIVAGYGSGAPTEACGDLTPQHPAKPKTTRSPYMIHVSKTRIRSNESVDVTLKPIKDDTFQGFLIQARVGATPVGKFSIPNNNGDVKLLNCSPGAQDAVTHSSPKEKKEITVTWTPPPGLTEQVIFYYTVAKTGDEYWVAQKSRTVSVH
ncbi:reeler domain-containing lethal (2) 34Fc [Rhodnius prolixus]|uniref:reeler domain-containing lethal (2) 34Fc n=1 Tax=Rhodnius prolixus TaxID=13249 RepID=UPI003D18C6EA